MHLPGVDSLPAFLAQNEMEASPAIGTGHFQVLVIFRVLRGIDLGNGQEITTEFAKAVAGGRDIDLKTAFDGWFVVCGIPMSIGATALLMN
jgi:hypothetical protein